MQYYLYTLDGIKPAHAGKPFLDYAAREVVKITAEDNL